MDNKKIVELLKVLKKKTRKTRFLVFSNSLLIFTKS